MTGLVKRSFRFHLIVMRTLGLYPPKRYRNLYKIHAYIMHIFFIIPMPTLAAVYLLVTENVTLEQISDSAFLICQIGCFIVKLLPFINNHEQVRRTIYHIEHPLFVMYSKKQEVMIIECIKICKRNCRIFLGCCLTTLTLWAIKPFLLKECKLPLQIWWPFDITKGPKVYFPAFVYCVLGIANGAVSNGVIDPLIAGLAGHATAQLQILKDNLQNVAEYAEEMMSKMDGEVDDTVRDKIIYDRIKLSVEHHSEILRFVDMYEETFSSVVFIQFSASVVVICVSCLQMSVVSPTSVSFISMFLFLVTMLSEIYLYCYYGTTLFEENNSLAQAIYLGTWYEFDARSKKALIILMERSKRPMIVTAGKILDLSLETFTTILRRAYSLLAVLKNY